jgi:hypothetical protein
VSSLQRSGWSVSTRYDERRSVTEFGDHGAALVRLYPCSGNDSEPLNVIWDLVHEWGHLLLGPGSVAERLTCEHERKVWRRGWQELCEKCPELKAHLNQFEKRKEDCLRSYCGAGRHGGEER